MTRDDVLAKLEEAMKEPDKEAAHVLADAALLAYINDPEIHAAYRAIKKWYA